MSIEDTKEKIIENLKQVYDPEISINVYDLGLIYDIKVGEGYCDITMTLTSAFCPAADYIIEDVKGAAMSAGVSLVNVDVVFDPPWGPESMSEDAKLLLDMF
jgi:metal-sulfur cluster biosynthetic enzyme